MSKILPAVINSIKFEAKLSCSVSITDADAEYIFTKHRELIKTLPKQQAYNMNYLKKIMMEYLESKYPDQYKPATSIEEIIKNLK
ncbi:MAG: hypothetical protein ABIT08_11320 [Bacteroidia bacterium]